MVSYFKEVFGFYGVCKNNMYDNLYIACAGERDGSGLESRGIEDFRGF